MYIGLGGIACAARATPPNNMPANTGTSFVCDTILMFWRNCYKFTTAQLSDMFLNTGWAKKVALTT